MNSHRDILVIGASAGGVGALRQLVSELPKDFPASIFIVQHTSPDSPGLMAGILETHCVLPVSFPRDGQKIESGHVYIAPPDRHLVLGPQEVFVTSGPRENRFRPAVDVLFRSAALAFGPRVIGVVLTGYLDDGASGLYAIKERGGVAVVQTPEDAEVPDMPRNALRRVQADEIVPLREMAKLLSLLVIEPIPGEGGFPVSDIDNKKLEIEVGIAKEDHALDKGVLSLGDPSLLTCPECHGVLLQIKEGSGTRFRCHTGHAFSLDSLLSEVTQSVEESLWSSLRAIEETEMILARMADHLRQHGETAALAVVEQQIQESKRRQQLVRQAVLSNKTLSGDKLSADADQE